MAWSRRRVVIWACVLGATTSVIGIGVATGAKLKTSSETVSVDSGENGSATAKCEKDTKALSGGFESEFDSDTPLTSPFLEVNESGGAGWRDWVSSGFNDGAAAGELTSFVHCRDPKVTRVGTG
jgi:hypothetical protein